MRNHLFFFILSIFFCCSDKISQTEKDILKYFYLQPFILERQQFISGNLDADNNNLNYSYRVKNINNEILKIKNKAFSDGWKLKDNFYTKYIKIYNDSGETIRVEVIKNKDVIHFKVHSE